MPSKNVESPKLLTRSKKRPANANSAKSPKEKPASTKRPASDRMKIEVAATRRSTRLSNMSDSEIALLFEDATQPNEVSLFTAWQDPTTYSFYSPASRYHRELSGAIKEAQLGPGLKPVFSYIHKPSSLPPRISVHAELSFKRVTVPNSNTLQPGIQEGTTKEFERVLRMAALNLANATVAKVAIKYPDGSVGIRGFENMEQKRVYFTTTSLIDELQETMRSIGLLGGGLWQLESSSENLVLRYRAEVDAPMCQRETNVNARKDRKERDECAEVSLGKLLQTQVSAYLFLVGLSPSSGYDGIASRLIKVTGKKSGPSPSSVVATAAKRRRNDGELQEQIARVERISNEDSPNPNSKGPTAKRRPPSKSSPVKTAVVALPMRVKTPKIPKASTMKPTSLADVEERGTLRIPGAIVKELAKKNLLNSVVEQKQVDGRATTVVYSPTELPTRINENKMYSVNFDMNDRRKIERELEQARYDERTQGNVKSYAKAKALEKTAKTARKLDTLANARSKIKIKN
jgi:hypothetical protein